MISNSIFELLQHVEIFNGIPADLLKNLAGKLEQINIETGALIIRKGEEGNAMFVLMKGKVKIHDGEHVIAYMEQGNYFGEFYLANFVFNFHKCPQNLNSPRPIVNKSF